MVYMVWWQVIMAKWYWREDNHGDVTLHWKEGNMASCEGSQRTSYNE